MSFAISSTRILIEWLMPLQFSTCMVKLPLKWSRARTQKPFLCVKEPYGWIDKTYGTDLLTHCNTLQHTATHCNTLQHTATHCNTLQHTAIHCNTLQQTATHCNTLQHTDELKRLMGQNKSSLAMSKSCRTSSCSVLQCAAVCCSQLQCVAVCSSVLANHVAPRVAVYIKHVCCITAVHRSAAVYTSIGLVYKHI